MLTRPLDPRPSQDALNDSLKATQLDKQFTKGYVRAGKACMCMGEFDRAKELYEHARVRKHKGWRRGG